VFDAPTDMGTGPVASYPFEYTTNVDMIGHAARTYYAIERRAPVVYAIVDRATKTEHITFNGNTTRLADAANNLGFRKNTILQIPSNDYKVNYSWDSTVGTLANTDRAVNLTGPNISKTLLVISNSSDYTVDCVIVLDQYLDTVNKIIEQNDTKKYDLTTFDGDDQNIALDEAAEKDYVVITDVGNLGDMLLISAPELVEASISKISGRSDATSTVTGIVADGTEYSGSPVAHHRTATITTTGARSLDNTTNFEDIQTIGETTLILDFQGKCIGLGEPEVPELYAYVAQYATRHVDGFGTEDRLVAKVYLSDGTNGVYAVNTSAGRADTNSFYNYKHDDGSNGGPDSAEGNLDKLNKTTAANAGTAKDVYSDATFSMLNGNRGANGNGLGVFKASVRADGSIVLAKLSTDEADRAIAAKARAVVGHSTLVVTNAALGMVNGGNVTAGANPSEALYQTSKTTVFYVNGEWGNDDNPLTVAVRVGIDNIAKFTHGGAADDNNVPDEFVQVFANKIADRRQVSAEMVYGLDVGSSTDFVLYDQGHWHTPVVSTSRANEKLVTLVFDVYDLDGELKQITYDNDGRYYEEDEAQEEAREIPTGYYTVGAKKLEPVAVFHNTSDIGEKHTLSTTGSYTGDNGTKIKNGVFVLNATVDHVDFENNIFTKMEDVGGITKDAMVKDLTNNSYTTFNSIQDIDRACTAGNTVKISYYYDTTGSDAYKVKVVFVTGFDPKGTNVNVDSKNPSKAVIDEQSHRITVDALNDELDLSALYNALSAAGYYTVGFSLNPNMSSENEGDYLTALTLQKNGAVGVEMYSLYLGTKYFTISIDGKVAQYLAEDASSTEIDLTKINTKGGNYYCQVKGTATPVIGTDYHEYSVKVESKVANSSNMPINITTGYVKVTYPTGETVNGNNFAYTEVGKAYTLPKKSDVTTALKDNVNYIVTNGTTGLLAWGGTIPANEVTNDITLTESDVFMVKHNGDTKTFSSKDEAKAYVTNLIDKKGTGVAVGTSYAFAYGAFEPVANTAYETGYVKYTYKTGDVTKVSAAKAGVALTIENKGSGTGYELTIDPTAADPAKSYGDYDKAVTPSDKDIQVEDGMVKVVVDGEQKGYVKYNAALNLSAAPYNISKDIFYYCTADKATVKVASGSLGSISVPVGAAGWGTYGIYVDTKATLTTMTPATDENGVKTVLGEPDGNKKPQKAGGVIATIANDKDLLAGYGKKVWDDVTPGANLAVSFAVRAGQSYSMEIYRGTDVNDNSAMVWRDRSYTATADGFDMIFVCLKATGGYGNPNSGSGFLVGNNLPTGVYSYVTIIDGVKSTPVTFEFTAS
jgi:hypothetical protein